MHHPGLEGAEEEDADHVGDRIEKRDEHQNALIDDMKEIERSEDCVQPSPANKDQQGDLPGLEHWLLLSARAIVPLVLLLATHRSGLRGDEALAHLPDEGTGDEAHDNPGDGIGIIEEGDAIDTEKDVIGKKPQKQSASIEEADVIEFGDDGDSYALGVHRRGLL